VHRSLFRYDPTIGYLYIPNLRARIEHESGGYNLRTNASGFRCRHEFVDAKADPGRFRILLFGDSYTAGNGVTEKQRYGDLLESMLPGVEVFNFGLSGTGTDQHFLIFREMASSIEYDLVVVGVLVENIRRVAARYRFFEGPEGEKVLLPKPYFSLAGDGSLELHNVPVPKHANVDSLPADDQPYVYGDNAIPSVRFRTLRKLAGLLGPGTKERLQRLTPYQPLPAYNRPDNPDWLLMKAILRQWATEARRPLVVCPIPTHFHVEGIVSAKPYQRRFSELHDGEQLFVHDPLPDFHGLSPEERRACRFTSDPHFTPAAHAHLATSLARSLQPFVANRVVSE
jgi:hypothetical protein